MIDHALVNRKLSQIVEYLTALAPPGISYEDYLQQPTRYAAERLLQLLVDTAVDINAHLTVELTGTHPRITMTPLSKQHRPGALTLCSKPRQHRAAQSACPSI